MWNNDRSHCIVYNGEPSDVCRLADQTLWRFNYPLETIISTYNLLCHDYWLVTGQLYVVRTRYVVTTLTRIRIDCVITYRQYKNKIFSIKIITYSREQCLPQVLFYFGMLPSCLLAGYVSDQFGRKTSLILFLFMESLSLSLLIAVRGYIGFLILR